MKPGRELDALIAEKVIGWKDITSDFWGCPVPDRASMVPLHKYSTDIAAAWEVVEKMRREATDFKLQTTSNHGGYAVFGLLLSS